MGGDLTPMAPTPPSPLESWPQLYLNAQQLEELLIMNQPNRPGDDVKDNVLPYSHKKEWWEWERAKDEIKNMASGAAPLSFVDENEAVNHILQVVRRDESAIGITYNQSKEIDIHKDDRATNAPA